MNALPPPSVSVACPAQPCTELHGVVIVVYLNGSCSTTTLAGHWHYMFTAIARTPINIVDFAGFADRVLPITPLALGVEIVPLLVVGAFTTEPARCRRIVFP